MVSTTYTIQMASKISGVGVHTIRAWEKRYKALEPSRDASGHRTYSKTDVEKLMLLSELCLLGYTISKVAGLTIPELKNQLKDLGKSEESLENGDFSLVNDTKLTADTTQSLPILNFALKSYKLDVISQELGKLKTILSGKDFALKILMPLIHSLKEAHANGSYTSSQEQAARALLKFHMGHTLYHPTEKKDKMNVNIVVSGMEGDLNDLSLGVVGLLCGHYGLHYTYLGADITYEALGDTVRALEANVIILGPSKNHLQNYIEKLSTRVLPSTELVIAGHADLDLEKIALRRLVVLKTLDAIDDYLSKKHI